MTTINAALAAVATTLALTLSQAACATPPPPPPPLVDAPPFYDELAPHGDWWWNDHYGWVWSPYVDAGWRPYTIGHWVWTSEYGWYWESIEPFGWACFHYGRWIWLDDTGWLWIPGHTWGPAWVSWRHGPGFIGWVPMGHEHGHVWWVFVEEPRFLAPNIVVVVVPPARNHVVLPSTTVIHRPERDEHPGDRDDDGRERVSARALHRGPALEDVERATGVRVQPRALVVDEEARADARRPLADDDVVRVRRAFDVEREGIDDTRATRPLRDDPRDLERMPRPTQPSPLRTPERERIERTPTDRAAPDDDDDDAIGTQRPGTDVKKKQVDKRKAPKKKVPRTPQPTKR